MKSAKNVSLIIFSFAMPLNARKLRNLFCFNKSFSCVQRQIFILNLPRTSERLNERLKWETCFGGVNWVLFRKIGKNWRKYKKFVIIMFLVQKSIKGSHFNITDAQTPRQRKFLRTCRIVELKPSSRSNWFPQIHDLFPFPSERNTTARGSHVWDCDSAKAGK